MASQQSVQGYLERQKVGGLFEELMQKLIKEMPNEPLPFLIRILQKKLDKQTASLAKSSDDLFESNLRKSTDAYGDNLMVEKSRGYEKPWLTNARRQKAKKPTEADEPETIGPSHSMKKSMSDDHDDWAKSFKKDEKEKKHKKKEEKTKRKVTRHVDDDDDLADELMAPKSLRSQESTSDKHSDNAVSAHKGKLKGIKADASKHKQDLEKLVLSQQTNKENVDEAEDDTMDTATEVLEDADDLREEGVANVKTSGHKVSKGKSHSAPEVKVGVCAWCARLLTGDNVSKSHGKHKSSKSSDSDSESTTSRSTARSSVTIKNLKRRSGGRDFDVDDDDDDFESVSQVTGPRAPVWEDNDSDAATLTPRKGTHMLSKTTQPMKGRSMLSDFAGSASPSPRTARTVTLKDDRAFTPNRTWSAGMKTEDLTRGVASARSIDYFNKERQGWKVAEDSDGGSTVDLENERPKSHRGYRK